MTEFRIHADPERTAAAAADYLFQQINDCVRDRGACHLVLPGGSTPARCLELLAGRPLPWGQLHCYPSDERCLPRGDAQRNDRMIIDKLFGGDAASAGNFHAMPAELGAEAAAASYAGLIERLQRFDIALLGIGEDAHTASLFPGNPALQDRRAVVPVQEAPKPPPQRVSLGLSTLRDARQTLVLATGAGKREALASIRSGGSSPIALVRPDICFIDEAAAAEPARGEHD